MSTEFAADVYDSLMETGESFGIIDAGDFALESLRLEKGGHGVAELHSEITPLSAGLGFAVVMDKPDRFIRHDVMRVQKENIKKRIVQLVLREPGAQLWSGGL